MLSKEVITIERFIFWISIFYIIVGLFWYPIVCISTGVTQILVLALINSRFADPTLPWWERIVDMSAGNRVDSSKEKTIVELITESSEERAESRRKKRIDKVTKGN